GGKRRGERDRHTEGQAVHQVGEVEVAASECHQLRREALYLERGRDRTGLYSRDDLRLRCLHDERSKENKHAFHDGYLVRMPGSSYTPFSVAIVPPTSAVRIWSSLGLMMPSDASC